VGRSSTRDERRAQASAPLSLAFGNPKKLRRRAARCDRWGRAGRDHQPYRPAGASVSPHAARYSTIVGPDGIARELRALEVRDEMPGPLTSQPMLPHLIMPAHHEVRPNDVLVRRLHGNLAAAA